MAVFSSLPATYNNPYYSQPVIPQTQQQNHNAIIWVQGEAGAKSYMVAPNSTVQLWDSEDQIIYLKSADASGMPSMKIIDYTIRGAETPSEAFADADNKYVGKGEMDSILSRICSLEEEIKKLKPKKKKEEDE